MFAKFILTRGVSSPPRILRPSPPESFLISILLSSFLAGDLAGVLAGDLAGVAAGFAGEAPAAPPASAVDGDRVDLAGDGPAEAT